MSQGSTLTSDDTDRAERRRTKLILDFRAIGVHIDEDTPLDQFPQVDQITKLRMLATKHRRPISHLDLANRAAVTQELDRLMMLEGGTRRRGNFKRTTTMKVDLTPRNLSAAEKRARALDGRQVRDGRVASGRFAETTGYGSHASYSVQVADGRSMGAEPLIRPATDGQIDYIKSLAGQKNIKVGEIPTRFDLAQELLDELIAAKPAPSERQAKYLADMQAKCGETVKAVATADEARAELDRLIALHASR
jgi:hypothetical protein